MVDAISINKVRMGRSLSVVFEYPRDHELLIDDQEGSLTSPPSRKGISKPSLASGEAGYCVVLSIEVGILVGMFVFYSPKSQRTTAYLPTMMNQGERQYG